MTPTDLHTWRKSRGLTQEALAALLGVVRKTINEWENERAAIPPYLWLALKALEADHRAI
jgi:DNA-binding XRE family transcriptional regulator